MVLQWYANKFKDQHNWGPLDNDARAKKSELVLKGGSTWDSVCIFAKMEAVENQVFHHNMPCNKYNNFLGKSDQDIKREQVHSQVSWPAINGPGREPDRQGAAEAGEGGPFKSHSRRFQRGERREGGRFKVRLHQGYTKVNQIYLKKKNQYQ